MRSLQLRLHLLWIGRFLRDSIESGVSPGPGMVGRGGSSSVRFFLWLRSTLTSTFGPTPPSWGGELIFRICGTPWSLWSLAKGYFGVLEIWVISYGVT